MVEKLEVIHKKGVFSVSKPERQQDKVPLLFDSPHSGRVYPNDFETTCSLEDLERAEDRFVDQLFKEAPIHGTTLLQAEFPRLYIDANRCETDLHPRLINGQHPDICPRPSNKANAGIGLIHEKLNNGQKIMEDALHVNDIKSRIEYFYAPYHSQLHQELSSLINQFGTALHLNVHSMPAFTSPKVNQMSYLSNKAHKRQRADIVLGTLDGQSCSDEWADLVYNILRDIGFSVIMNTPFKGAEIVKRYGAPDQNSHSIQIEINRSLYLDELEHQKSQNFNNLRSALTDFTARLSAALSPN